MKSGLFFQKGLLVILGLPVSALRDPLYRGLAHLPERSACLRGPRQPGDQTDALTSSHWRGPGIFPWKQCSLLQRVFPPIISLDPHQNLGRLVLGGLRCADDEAKAHVR